MVDGTLGVSPKTMQSILFALYTGAGLNNIRREELPPEWENEVDINSAYPRVIYANGNPLALGKTVWLTVRF